MKRLGQLVAAVALVGGGMFITQGAAFADAPPVVGGGGETAFLCPSVGNETAAEANGKGWGELTAEDDRYTFLPGHNQAGANADANSNNTEGPGTSPGPGHNPDWSPLWPPPSP